MTIRMIAPLAALLFACSPGSKTTTDTGALEPSAAEAPAAAEQEPAAAEPAVEFFNGTVTVSSADGKTMKSMGEGLVKRELHEGEGLIVETIMDEGEFKVTKLTQREGTNVFDAQDIGGAFTGTVTYEPNAWAAESWTYDLTMSDGSGKVEGTGSMTEAAMHNEKYVIDADGNRVVKVVEHLTRVKQPTFESKAKALMK